MVATIESKAMNFSEVSALLWREREALELLLFKLVEEQLIISAGQTRWLPHANREIEAVLEELQTTEVLRALEVDSLAYDLGLAPGATLVELSELAPEPWNELLVEHRKALLVVMGAIEQAKGQNRVLLIAGARAARDTMLSVGESVGTYDATGNAAIQNSRPFLMDEQA